MSGLGGWCGAGRFVWLLAMLVALPVRADPAAAPETPAAELAFVVALQQAVRTGDKAWIAGHCRYPVRIGLPGLAKVADRAVLVRNYRRIFTPILTAAILAQDPEQVFRNWQGVMVGSGMLNIWIRDVGTDDANPRFKIITVNTSR